MQQITIHYQEKPGLDGLELEPYRMMIRFPGGELNWYEPCLYIPLGEPYEQMRADDYEGEDIISLTISSEEIILNNDKPNYFGIYLPRVLQRLESLKKQHRYKFDYHEIEQFIIRIDDLEEAIRTDLSRIYIWGGG